MKKLLLLLFLGIFLAGCGPSEPEAQYDKALKYYAEGDDESYKKWLNKAKKQNYAPAYYHSYLISQSNCLGDSLGCRKKLNALKDAASLGYAPAIDELPKFESQIQKNREEVKRKEAEAAAAIEEAERTAARAAAKEAIRIARYYDIKTDCPSMANEVRTNEVRATNKFSNKLILITGIVESISKDGITLSAGGQRSSNKYIIDKQGRKILNIYLSCPFCSCNIADLQYNVSSKIRSGSALSNYAATLNKGDRVAFKCGGTFTDPMGHIIEGRFVAFKDGEAKLGGCSRYLYDF